MTLTPGKIVTVYRNGGSTLIRVNGPMNREVIDYLRALRSDLFTPQMRDFYLNLGGLEWLDSAGLGLVVGFSSAARQQNAAFYLFKPSDRVLEQFRMSRLDRILQFIESPRTGEVEEALVKPEFLLDV